MNRLVSAGIGALLSLALAASASAAQLATVNPADPTFTLRAPVSYTHGVVGNGCTLVLTGTVSASGVATINTATTTGGGFCAPLPSPNPSWTITATSLTSLQLSGFQIVGVGGLCGPATIPMTWTGTTAYFTNVSMSGSPAPDCVVTSTMFPTNLTVVP